MVFLMNTAANAKSLLLVQEIADRLKSEKVLFTSSKDIYLNTGDEVLQFNRRFYSSSLYGVNGKNFGLAYMEQNFLNNDVVFQKLSQVVDRGIIFKYQVPWSFDNFFQQIKAYEAGLAAQELVKKENEELKEAYREKREAYRENRRILKEAYEAELEAWKDAKEEVKKANKAQLAEWQEAFDKADESLKKFIAKPEEIPEPPKPAEPDYGEKPAEPPLKALPRVEGVRELRLDNTLAFRILRRFRFCKVTGTEWGLLIKREKDLTFTIDNLGILELEEISKDEFLSFIEKNDVDFKASQGIKQSFFDMDTPELLAAIDTSLSELIYEEDENEDIHLVPLAPIKPMHAASMLAGGLGEYYNEVILDGDVVALKGAMVKESIERKTLLQGKEITEIIETQTQKLGVYNLSDFSFSLM